MTHRAIDKKQRVKAATLVTKKEFLLSCFIDVSVLLLKKYPIITTSFLQKKNYDNRNIRLTYGKSCVDVR